ncbi:hypothetical protein F7725_014529 [Dissostichus mawsoni]|uniref:Uncharacterized protein n=1 Tax=Dissostichus mawsoni TaxID=36200 RepID=A0A7J5YYE0_DISMA|nr:hypothetical protein F7725_014529 [Dissostichus mawsoni]
MELLRRSVSDFDMPVKSYSFQAQAVAKLQRELTPALPPLLPSRTAMGETGADRWRNCDVSPLQQGFQRGTLLKSQLLGKKVQSRSVSSAPLTSSFSPVTWLTQRKLQSNSEDGKGVCVCACCPVSPLGWDRVNPLVFLIYSLNTQQGVHILRGRAHVLVFLPLFVFAPIDQTTCGLTCRRIIASSQRKWQPYESFVPS